MDTRSAWMGDLRVMTKLPGELPVVGLAWSPDGSRLAVADHSGNRMNVWNLASETQMFSVAKKNASGHSIAFTADGKFLLVESLKGNDAQRTIFNVLDAFDGTPLRAITGPSPDRPNSASLFALSSDGRHIAAVPRGRNELVAIYDTDTYSPVEQIEWPKNAVRAMAFGPSGRLLALGGYDGTVLLHEIGSQSGDVSFKAQPSDIFALAFSPDGRTLITGMRSAFSGIGPEADLEQLRAAEKHKIRAYEVSTRMLIGSDDGNLPCVSAFSFHPGGEMLAVACDRTAYLFDRNLRFLRELPAPGPLVMTLAFSPDGRALAIGAADSTVVFVPAQPPK
jgi:WD40 repeat protein